MATEVYTTEEIRLLDGTETEIRPLSIAKMRKFTKIWSAHMKDLATTFAERVDSDENDLPDDEEMTQKQYDVFVKLCALGLSELKKEGATDKKFLEWLEDVLDEHTIAKVLKVTGGLDLSRGDETPNLNPATEPGGTI